jgi:hypothetical protein
VDLLLVKSCDKILVVEDCKQASPNSEKRLDKVLVLCGSGFVAFLANKINARLHNDIHESVNCLLVVIIEARGELILPRVEDWAPSHLMRLHVYHAAARNRGG